MFAAIYAFLGANALADGLPADGARVEMPPLSRRAPSYDDIVRAMVYERMTSLEAVVEVERATQRSTVRRDHANAACERRAQVQGVAQVVAAGAGVADGRRRLRAREHRMRPGRLLERDRRGLAAREQQAHEGQRQRRRQCQPQACEQGTQGWGKPIAIRIAVSSAPM